PHTLPIDDDRRVPAVGNHPRRCAGNRHADAHPGADRETAGNQHGALRRRGRCHPGNLGVHAAGRNQPARRLLRGPRAASGSDATGAVVPGPAARHRVRHCLRSAIESVLAASRRLQPLIGSKEATVTLLRSWRAAWLIVLCGVALSVTFSAQSLPGRDDDIHTYSILGYDPETGDVGIAIASRVFNVSSFYGKAGVGVVSLQHSFSGQNLMTAVEGVALMEKGLAPADAIKTLMVKDAGREWRQMGAVDVKGRVAGYTGPKCTYWSGDRQG